MVRRQQINLAQAATTVQSYSLSSKYNNLLDGFVSSWHHETFIIFQVISLFLKSRIFSLKELIFSHDGTFCYTLVSIIKNLKSFKECSSEEKQNL